jgi:hypothetical protein
MKINKDDKPDPETLDFMRSSAFTFPDTKWAAYQNHDLGHRQLGHLRFLAVGPQNTIKETPKPRLPDFSNEINWRYQFVGYVDLKSGEIVDE